MSLMQEPVAVKDLGEQFLQDVENFNQRAVAVGLGDVGNYYWYHTVELPYGLVTPGLYDFRASLSCFPFPEDMRDMTVLDIGSATGFFAFEFERRGARVVSVELPSLYALDRFPGQKIEHTLETIEQMIVPRSLDGLGGFIKKFTAEQLYFYLLEGPFEFCRKLLNSNIERCYSTIYELSPANLGAESFDLVFMGDVLLHTLNPLAALAAVAPLCRDTLVLSQVMPEDNKGQPVMHYVGGEDSKSDELSWWWPNESCLAQLLKKLGFRDVVRVGKHTGTLRPSGFGYERSILRAVK
jgi:tRNA (mo5U34)-methyltransferase